MASGISEAGNQAPPVKATISENTFANPFAASSDTPHCPSANPNATAISAYVSTVTAHSAKDSGAIEASVPNGSISSADSAR